MAAVRRSSESGVVIALVVFFVLFVVCLGCAIWFFQQFSAAKQAIAADTDAFGRTVHAVFRQNNWQLTTQTASSLGVSYVEESYNQVAGKLKVASEYERKARPTAGWESLQGMQDALTASPAQEDLRAKGEAEFATVKGLLGFYEQRYVSLTDEVANLRAQNGQLTEQANQARAKQVAEVKRVQDEMNQKSQVFRNTLAKLRKQYTELQGQLDQKRRDQADWQGKYRQVVVERGTEADDLRRQVRDWKKRYEDEVRGPAEGEAMAPDGKVASVQPDHGFVYIEGGKDQDVKENDRFVIYRVTPDGKDTRQAVIQIGEVHEHVSMGTIARKRGIILEGDLYVSEQKWAYFHRKGAAGQGG